MSGEIRIEKLNASHRASWMRLWGLYLEFYETTRSEEIFDLSFERLIDPDFTECEGFLALSD
ncbi:MAG: GNAT family N-acetyltransferase, partial [Paracoccaceae bacterium]|nr:GNAT family N-acetyltransferase [Paracoccaceae bacterium]